MPRVPKTVAATHVETSLDILVDEITKKEEFAAPSGRIAKPLEHHANVSAKILRLHEKREK